MLEIFENLEDEDAEQDEIPTEYGFDFETGEMTGETVTGLDAIKIWAYFALRIQRYRWRQFTWAYGSQTEELVGKNYGVDFEISELQRYIADCLLVNPFIKEVTNFKTAFSGCTLSASFSIVTDYGEAALDYREDVS